MGWYPEELQGSIEVQPGGEFWVFAGSSANLASNWAQLLPICRRSGSYPVLLSENPSDRFWFSPDVEYPAEYPAEDHSTTEDLSGELVRELSTVYVPAQVGYLAVVRADSMSELLHKVCDEQIPEEALVEITSLTNSIICVLDGWEASLFSFRFWDEQALSRTHDEIERILDDLRCPTPASSHRRDGRWWDINFRR